MSLLVWLLLDIDLPVEFDWIEGRVAMTSAGPRIIIGITDENFMFE